MAETNRYEKLETNYSYKTVILNIYDLTGRTKNGFSEIPGRYAMPF